MSGMQECLEEVTRLLFETGDEFGNVEKDNNNDKEVDTGVNDCRASETVITRDVVIAQGRNEDLSWVSGIHPRNTNTCANQLTCSEIDKEWETRLQSLPSLEEIGARPVIYTKGIHKNDNPLHTKLPYNVGGEAVAYLYHIITHYDELADVTIFLQVS